MTREIGRSAIRAMGMTGVLALAIGGARIDAAESAQSASTQGRLVLAIQSAQTAPNGQRCDLAVMARNNTGAGALNVQAAWMAQTEGFGIISDYQVLGDFAVGEVRAVRLSIFGAPCNAVRELKLSRTVCAVGPVKDPPQSCADRVTLEGVGVLVSPRR